MAGEFVIGYDVGTGGSKAVLLNLEGELLAEEFEPYPVHYPDTGFAEQDPEDWWNATAAATRRLLVSSKIPPGEVLGIAFATQMLGVLPLAGSGEPLTRGIIWMDCRAEEQARRIVRKLGGRRLLMAALGAVPSGKDVLCKIKWIEENQPEVFDRTRYFLDTKGYMVLRATGRFETDHTAASVTGIYDRKKRGWSPLAARILGVPLSKMPPVKLSSDIAGGLIAPAAEDMGLPEGTPVISGMGDAPAACLGAGALEHGESVITIGTSGLLCITCRDTVNLGKSGMASIAAAEPDMCLLVGETNTAGACLKWFSEQLSTPSERQEGVYQALNRAAASVPPGAGNLIFTPWMYGEKAPVTDTSLRGGFVNLSIDHTREHMLRALFEGVAMNFRWMFEAAAGKGLPCPTTRAIGGGASSDVWMQIFADVTGRVIQAVESAAEAGAGGAALAVTAALGAYHGYRGLKQVVRIRKTFRPLPENKAVYDRMFGSFKELYRSLSPVYRSLNANV